MLDFEGLYEQGESIVFDAISDALDEIKDNIKSLSIDIDDIDADEITIGSKAYDVMQSKVMDAINEIAFITSQQAYAELTKSQFVEDVGMPDVLESARTELERVYMSYVKLAIDNSKKSLGQTIERAKSKYRDKRRVLAYIAEAYFLNMKFRAALDNYVSSLEREIDDSDKDNLIPAYEPEEVDLLEEIYIDSAEESRIDAIAVLVSTSTVGLSAQSVVAGLAGAGAITRAIRKYWVTMNDGAVRNSHVAIPRLNAEGVSLEGTFITPLGPLRYPGDTMGTAANVINCRCHLTYKIGGYDAL